MITEMNRLTFAIDEYLDNHAASDHEDIRYHHDRQGVSMLILVGAYSVAHWSVAKGRLARARPVIHDEPSIVAATLSNHDS